MYGHCLFGFLWIFVVVFIVVLIGKYNAKFLDKENKTSTQRIPKHNL